MQWTVANGAALVSLLSLALAFAVGIAHLVHADKVASSLSAVEDAVSKLTNQAKP